MVSLPYCMVRPSHIKENIIVKNKPIWVKIGKLFLDIIEIYIPAITFSLLFIAFLIQVFFPLFFSAPHLALRIYFDDVQLDHFIWGMLCNA